MSVCCINWQFMGLQYEHSRQNGNSHCDIFLIQGLVMPCVKLAAHSNDTKQFIVTNANSGQMQAIGLRTSDVTFCSCSSLSKASVRYIYV